MILFPAIDLFGGQAVRLFKGDYRQMTVYDPEPLNTARKFETAGASHLHMVDLEGAKDGTTPNLSVVRKIAEGTGLFIEVGGGVRSLETIKTYLDAGVDRVILGTAAVTSPGFVEQAVARFGPEQIAVGADLKDGKVAIRGWLETSQYGCDEFCTKMQDLGVQYLICTDISRDGAMQGTNRDLYRHLTGAFRMHITASGGVSSLEDLAALREADVYGAIIGKAYYTGAIDLADAVQRMEGGGGA